MGERGKGKKLGRRVTPPPPMKGGIKGGIKGFSEGKFFSIWFPFCCNQKLLRKVGVNV
jgi:hypothetical protein